MDKRPSPLTGIRVLDLTRLLPGPVCTLHLADLGAEVIKVEDTGIGDYARNMGVEEGQLSPLFIAINRNKKSFSVDLKTKSGKSVFIELLKTADVLIEGFRPGVMERLGLSYEQCKEHKSSIVYCSITGYGQDGPYKFKAGHDINYIGYAGVLSQIGTKGGMPAIPNLQVGDILGGALVPAMTVLAALLEAQKTNQGRQIDISMTDAVLAHNYQALVEVVKSGKAGKRGGEILSGREPCYGVYKTLDERFLAVGALEQKFWKQLCQAIGRSDLEPIHWENPDADFEYGKSELSKVFASKTQAHWVSVFENKDCCVSPVLNLDETMLNDQIKFREMVFFADHPISGKSLQFSTPFKMSEFGIEANLPAPRQGEHTVEIMKELGFSETEIRVLGPTLKFDQ